jgi:hypothetical protein
MSLNKLVRQLRGEARANPKKAAILGVLGLVALYFWGPLVWGRVAPEQASGGPPGTDGHRPEVGRLVPEADANAAPFPSTASTQPQPSAKEEEQACPYPWTQLNEWMRQDPMTTAEDLTGWRDPFDPIVSAEDMDEHERAQAGAPQVTPESLAVELSGTLIGPRRRVALIGGKAYREGQTVTIDHSGQPVELNLIEVHPRRIVLEWEGNRLDLAIPERNTAGQIELDAQTP